MLRNAPSLDGGTELARRPLFRNAMRVMSLLVRTTPLRLGRLPVLALSRRGAFLAESFTGRGPTCSTSTGVHRPRKDLTYEGS